MAAPSVNGSVSTQTGGTDVLQITKAHTVAADLEDSLLLVIVQNGQFAKPTACAWNGTPMTKMNLTVGNIYTEAFYLKNPEAGSFNVVIDYSTVSRGACITIITLEGAGRPILHNQSSGNTNSPSVSLTTTRADCLLISALYGFLSGWPTGAHSQGSGQTELSEFTNTMSGTQVRHSTSSKEIASPGSASVSATIANGVADETIQMSVIAVPPPGGSTGEMFLVF